MLRANHLYFIEGEYGERLQPGHQINRSHDGKCLETMVVSMSYERR
jgi:hypothetical protein